MYEEFPKKLIRSSEQIKSELETTIDQKAAEIYNKNNICEQLINQKQKRLDPLYISKKRTKKMKARNPSNAGSQWFNMKSVDLNTENKQLLKAIELRRFLGPTNFYKKSDYEEYKPKFFQVGTILSNPFDTSEKKLQKQEKKQNILEEMIHDDNLKNYTRRKFLEIQNQKEKIAKKKLALRKNIEKKWKKKS